MKFDCKLICQPSHVDRTVMFLSKPALCKTKGELQMAHWWVTSARIGSVNGSSRNVKATDDENTP